MAFDQLNRFVKSLENIPRGNVRPRIVDNDRQSVNYV